MKSCLTNCKHHVRSSWLSSQRKVTIELSCLLNKWKRSNCQKAMANYLVNLSTSSQHQNQPTLFGRTDSLLSSPELGREQSVISLSYVYWPSLPQPSTFAHLPLHIWRLNTQKLLALLRQRNITSHINKLPQNGWMNLVTKALAIVNNSRWKQLESMLHRV